MPRVVRCGLIQASCEWSPEKYSLAQIKQKMMAKHEDLIASAAKKKVQVLGLQELFYGPYFCAEQQTRWYELTEPVRNGPTITHMQKIANKHQIPHCHPGFWEKFYFTPGNAGYPVFETRYARVGVYICYDRHFPEGARCLGLNGAEIVYNPSATVAGLSEYLWKLEQPAHAVANGYFIAAINRVGTEAPWNIGEFYGTSYFCNPRGKIIAEAARDKDEGLTADLNRDELPEVGGPGSFLRTPG